MTSLEIKRLDNPLTPNGSVAQSSTSNRAASSGTNDFEIPISIIKSPSYVKVNDSMSRTSGTRSPPHSPTKISVTHVSPPPASVRTSTVPTSTTRKSPLKLQQSNGTALSNTDDFDSVLIINNNSSLMPNNENGTLSFNKYGFLQTADASKSNTISGKSATLAKSAKGNSNDHGDASNKKATRIDEHSNDDNATDNSTAATNLKDYIQNTDVEEFSEHLPIEVIRGRETKWIEMLKHFDEWMEHRFQKIKSRCRKGIPQSMRSRAWLHLTGAIVQKDKQPNYYNECLQNLKQVDVSKYIEDIKKDLHRQFPGHEIFMKREGRQMLYNVLRAYAVHNREVGYCQAQGPIAAVLLMHMPEEDAFWMLVKISDTYLKEYFKPGLEKVQIDGQTLFYLFKRENPAAHKLLKTQTIDPILYMTEWFMCIYARTLPWCTILRVWDMFFCEGVKVLYRVGLFLMKSAFEDKAKLQRCTQQGMYETMNQLKNLPVAYLHEAYLVRESSFIKVSEKDLVKAFNKSKIEFQKQMNEMNRNRKQAPPPSSYTNTNKK